MKHSILPLLFVLILAACGSSTNDVGTASGDLPQDGEVTDASLPLADDPESVEAQLPVSDQENAPVAVDDEFVISNDVIVDPQVFTPSELVLNPDNDSELWIRFIGAAPDCTAASATILTETPDIIEVELLVGITEDALVRSCEAGEFNLRVDLPLNESGVGKNISALQADTGEAPLVTPDLDTDDFVGLTEDEAAAIADENIIPWRIVEVDGEFFVVTEDFSPGRLNFTIENGVITAVTLG